LLSRRVLFRVPFSKVVFVILGAAIVAPIEVVAPPIKLLFFIAPLKPPRLLVPVKVAPLAKLPKFIFFKDLNAFIPKFKMPPIAAVFLI